MKSYRKELWLNTIGRCEFINITVQIEQCVAESGVSEGVALVNAMHNTAAVFINDDEAGLLQDVDDWLEKLAPRQAASPYRHNQTGEDNAEAHLKRLLLGREVMVAITEGQLDFGAFEQIIFADFDGGRPKRVLVKIIGA